jgi:bifunctional UDP-N-acetylglucosamine pyrophosphorylase/glucosamine-1-phosphate N-acetyltransferase
MTPIISVAILAAGLGTRMKSKKAKVLHRAGGLSLVEHVVRGALEITDAGNVVVVVGHQAAEVKGLLSPYGVRFAEQTEQRGTGHALQMTEPLLGAAPGYLVVLYGDCPLLQVSTIRELVRCQDSSTAGATLITTFLDNPHGYGRIVRNDAGDVAAIVEQKALAAGQEEIREINSGIYCFRTDLLWPHLAALEPNPKSGEVYLTDIIEALAAHGQRVAPMVVDDAAELLGINTRVELAEVDAIFRQRKVRQLMLDGVTVEKPETVTVDLDVEIGMDTTVEPFAQILGKTRIGADCKVGMGSVIRDSELGDGVQVEAYSFVGTSRVAAGAHVGPFARLRMDNDVGPGAHIGNFVELKKTRLGAGSKAMHLAYLGDSVIGQGVNVGAGTITCNYDGDKKHRTEIGDGAFIGSNSTLVAPVTVEIDSYVGAGSVITDRVPEGTLALGRARQVIKEGWKRKKKI